MKKTVFLLITMLVAAGAYAASPTFQDLTKQGRNAEIRGKFVEAEKLYKTSLKLRQKEFSAESKEVAVGLRDLAGIALEMEQFSLAESYITQALAIEVKKFGANSPDAAISNVTYSKVLFYKGKYSESRKLIEQTVKILKGKYGDDAEITSKACFWLCSLYKVLGLYRQSEPIIMQNLKLQQKKTPNSLQTLKWKRYMANIVGYKGKLQKALNMVDSEIIPFLKPWGDQSQVRLNTSQAKYSFLKQLSRKDEAEKLLGEIEIITDKLAGKESLHAIFIISQEARQYSVEHNYHKAIELAMKGEKVCTAKVGGKHLFTYTYITMRGTFYLRQRKSNKAAELLCDYYDFAKANMPLDGTVYANALYQMGALYRQEEKRAQAEKMFKTALPVFHKQLGKYSPWLALCYNELALLAGQERRYDEAAWLAEKVKNVYVGYNGKDHPYTAQAWSNLGYSYLGCRKYSQAIVAYQEALRILRLKFGDNHIRVARAYAMLCNAYMCANKYDKAREPCLKALAICEKIKPQNTNDFAVIFGLCSHYFSHNKKNPARAIELLERTIAIMSKLLGPNDQRIQYYKRRLKKLKP